MDSYSLFLIVLLFKKSIALYSFQCPVQAHWKLRSETICDSGDRYFCLYDQNKNNYREFCRENPEFEGLGQKLIVAGSINGTLQGADCDNDFYQPFQFWSSENSRCVFKKSYCSGEGQTILNNGTWLKDRSCRCDYTNGYDFIVQPKHRCHCVPTQEDCSCHLKTCSSNDILSPDNECLGKNEWKTSFECDQIVPVIRFPKDIEILSIMDPGFETYVPVKYELGKYSKQACVPVVLLISIIIMLMIWLLTLNSLSKLCKSKYSDSNLNTVPDRIKEFQDETRQNWEKKLNKIVSTRATEFIYQTIMKRNIIVIAGPTGSGKSAIAYYVAYKLKENYGHSIIPARHSEDITNYREPGTKQIFIVDDFIGKYTVNETDVYLWEKHWPLLKEIFDDNDDTKLILTSRTYVWQPERYNNLGLGPYTCDLLSDQIKLSLTERWDICHSYLKESEIKALEEETILMYSFFPTLCSSYTPSVNISVEHFFESPYQIIEEEINNFQIKSPISFIALAILAIKRTISNTAFSIDNDEYDELFQDVFHESTLLKHPSKRLLESSLFALTGTYVIKDNDNFIFPHETLRNIVVRCIAKQFIKSVIKFSESRLILNQLQSDCLYAKHNAFTIKVTSENEDSYFQRLVHELGKGWNSSIFENEQNKNLEFRLKFLKYLKSNLSRDYWKINSDEIPALHVVSALGYHDYVSFFSQDSTKINHQDINGNIPLHLACMNGHPKIVKYLVEHNSIVDIANGEGLKPFMYACAYNHIQVATYLLRYSAKPINLDEKYQTLNKRSVLHIVSAKGFVNLVKLLLTNEADVDVRDEMECTPLHLASDSAVIKVLLSSNANINAADSKGRRPITIACSRKQEKVCQPLIEKNDDINEKTMVGMKHLNAVFQFGNISIVRLLLKKGAKINSLKPGISPLHEACNVGNECIANFLIESKASVNHKTKDGVTPLHEACMNGHINVTKILLDNKANINESNKYGWTALLFGSSKGFHLIVDVLLQYGANVDICDEDKVSPLIAACKENCMEVVDFLLRSNANVNHCDKDNCSSLLVACQTGNANLVNLLVTYGADINLADKNMISPLHTACMNHHTNVVLALIEHKVNVNAQDNLRQTPLFKSSLNGYIDILHILLNHGASVNICDKFRISPLAIAEMKGHNTIVEALRQYRPISQIV